MADINLLPDNLRNREEKERRHAAHHRGSADISMSNPERGVAPRRLATPQQSWWRRIFGEPNRGHAPLIDRSHAPAAPAPTRAAQPPAAAKRPAAPRRPKNSRWRRLFGSPALPGLTAESRPHHALPAPSAPPVATPAVSAPRRPEHTMSFSAPPAPPRPTPKAQPHRSASPTGWWAILHSFFHPRRKVTPRLAHERPDAPPMPAKSSAPVTPPVPPVPPARHHATASPAPKSAKHNFDINLIPEELMSRVRISSHGQKTALVMAVIIPIIIITIMSLVLHQADRIIDAKIKSNHEAIAKLESALVSYQAEQSSEQQIARKLLAIKTLWQNHVYWSSFFTQLEKYTLDDVRYEKLTANASRELIIPAVATDYQAAARQLAVLQEAPDFVEAVTVSDLKLLTNSRQGAIGVAFNLKLLLDAQLLTRH